MGFVTMQLKRTNNLTSDLGEESLAQIKERVNAKKTHRKTDTETKLKKIHRMSNKEDRFQVYEDLVFAQKFLSSYSPL